MFLTMLGALATGAAGAGTEQVFVARADNGLARTPPMGWNSWNKYGCEIDEQLIRRQADALIASGMKQAGYRYLVIDDCWQVDRDASGNILADPQRFPGGIAALAAYIHAKGLQFGIYSDAGDRTCQKRPGSRGHEYQDAAQYAAWGVDYLKFDWCHAESLDARSAYETMSDALRATGRPIVFSICEWGIHKPWLWAASVGGNLWRTSPDISDLWVGKARNVDLFGVLDILDLQAGLEVYAGPGHWNDPDMLEVGNGGMTPDQYRAHFSLWAMLAAPLIAGNDLSTMNASTARILTNREVIAVDQDPLGVAGRRAFKDGDAEIWVRPLVGGSQAVVLLNRGDSPRPIRLTWEMLRLPAYLPLDTQDLWTDKRGRGLTHSVSFDVAPTSAVMLRVTPRLAGRRPAGAGPSASARPQVPQARASDLSCGYSAINCRITPLVQPKPS
jgi:alpha-galactosidase